VNIFDAAKIVAGLIFFGGLYLFWVNRERRHVKGKVYPPTPWPDPPHHGKPVEDYIADLRDAKVHPKPITGRLTWFWRKRLRG
jgi:hypothetical protein